MYYLGCNTSFAVDVDGVISCSDPVVLSASDLSASLDTTSLSDLYALLDAVFETPAASDITIAFMAAFTLPLIFYVVSRSYSSVINFIK